MNTSKATFCGLVLLLLFISCGQPRHESKLLDGDTWKQQGLETVIPAWTKNAVDSTDGQFYAFLDREWNPYKEDTKYPGMMSRHLFSYSVAYMLSGEQRYLDKADKLFDYLIDRGWDQQYGGWYYALDPKGQAVDTKKDLFMNIYAATGLTMYYMVTHDETAMNYIQKTRTLLQQHAWDAQHKGYYRILDREWNVTNANKVFTPQVAPVSGYLLYLYAATRDQQYVEQAEKLMALVSEHLQDPELGWIRESFDREWNPQASSKSQERINVGHNIEVSWMRLRLSAITGDSTYKQKAEQLYKKLHKYAATSQGAWLHKMPLTNPKEHGQTTPWWIQAYGDMLQLAMYQYGKHPESLEYYKKSAAFWNKGFVDEQYGGTVLSATLDGQIDRGDKAVRTKTSYHAMEHALLNHLSLNLWVQDQPVELYFHRNAESDSQPLCPLPIYDEEAAITKLSIDGETREVPGNAKKCIPLPDVSQGKIKVTIE